MSEEEKTKKLIENFNEVLQELKEYPRYYLFIYSWQFQAVKKYLEPQLRKIRQSENRDYVIYQIDKTGCYFIEKKPAFRSHQEAIISCAESTVKTIKVLKSFDSIVHYFTTTSFRVHIK